MFTDDAIGIIEKWAKAPVGEARARLAALGPISGSTAPRGIREITHPMAVCVIDDIPIDCGQNVRWQCASS